MADIFISYSHVDREQIIPLAEALTREGFSVWWDREESDGLKPGDDFAMVIEEELENAACVIVGWSKTSRKSTFVRDEARDAMERGVLAPIRLAKVKPPLGFRSLHTEDFITWNGDLKAECWERLVLQADALKQAAQPEAVEDTISTQTANQQLVLPQSASSETKPINEPNSIFSKINTSTFLILMILALIGGGWLSGGGKQIGILGLTSILAFMAYALFRQADQDLRPHMKALATRWLLPVKGSAKVNTPEAFLRLFEAVFGQKHLSWRCFKRSALASTIGFALILSLHHFADPTFLTNFESREEALLLFVFGGIAVIQINMIGDYLSLWETRLLLRFAARVPSLLLPIILLDTIATLIIFIFMYLIVVHSGLMISGFEAGLTEFLENSIEFSKTAIEHGTLGLIDFSDIGFKSDRTFFFSTILATSYLTSIWLWLAVLFTPLSRLLLWSKIGGLTVIGRLFNVNQKPFTALGFIIALLILFVGTAIWATDLVVNNGGS